MKDVQILQMLRFDRPWPALLAQNLAFAQLRSFRRGSLAVELPGGQMKIFGGVRAGPMAQIRVRREEFFLKSLIGGDIGFGESYMRGDWDSLDLVSVFEWFLANLKERENKKKFSSSLLGPLNKAIHTARRNSRRGSRRNISAHYDLSNDFFAQFLDPSMTYSSGLFESALTTLEEAQAAKTERMLAMLNLQSSDHVLEIGSGWGALAVAVARKYGCRVKTVTVSRNQFEYTKNLVAREGLQNLVEVALLDYRKLSGRFDKIVSIEMLEAVGDRYFETFFVKVQELLKPGGRLVLQSILCPDHKYSEYTKGVDWIRKHIFPGGHLPSVARINQAIRKTGGLEVYDYKDIGQDYARTLVEWRARFGQNTEAIRALGFDETFIRKWNYYFEYCRAGFLSRNVTAAQLVYTKPV